MMKYQVLFAVWALLAAHVSCDAVEPAELQYSDGSEVAKNDEGPVQIIESFEEVDLDSDLSEDRNSLLFRRTFRRTGVANKVLVHTIRYTGRAATRISAVHWTHLRNMGQTARITAGGVNRNTVTVEIRSARGRGYNTQVDIWGRYEINSFYFVNSAL